MKNRLSILAACLLFAIVFLAAPAAHAQCTNASLSGGWGYLLQYHQPLLGPFTVDLIFQGGLFVFDGAGHFTLTDDRTIYGPQGNYPASIVRGEQSNGTYVVNADCTGVIYTHQNPTTFVGFGPSNLISFTLTAPALTTATAAVTNPGWEVWTTVQNSNCATVNKATCNTFQPIWVGTMTKQ
jgi:hypothetical protein